MAGNPSIVVRFASNVRDFLSGTDQVERAFNDLEDESRDLAVSTERDTERMERAFKDAARTIDRESDKAGRSIRDGFGESAAQSGAEAGKEVGAEFTANLGESLASGDISSLGADTAGGLISGFASIGGPAGWAAAAIAAPATIAFSVVRAEAERTKEAVTSIFSELIASKGKLNEEFLSTRFETIYQEDVNKWRDVGDTLLNAGLRAGVIRDAIAGAAGPAKKVRDYYERTKEYAAEQYRIATATIDPTDKAAQLEQERASHAYTASLANMDAAEAVLKQSGYMDDALGTYETYATLAVRGANAEERRLTALKAQEESLRRLAAAVTPGSAASWRIAEERDRIARETAPGAGRRP